MTTPERHITLTGPGDRSDAVAFLGRALRLDDTAAMDEVLANVRSGAFVERLMKDYDAGSPDLLTRRRALGQRRIEAVGAHLAKVGEAANHA